jgi:endonuclease/exonuclease/phosphatase family metal-dependent hydrolase
MSLKMKIFILPGIWIWGMLLVAAQEPVELITYNIRLNTPGDGKHAWPCRKSEVAALFRFHRADIFCVQEALPDQVDDLAAAFPGFSYEGVGRDDGKRGGEFCAIFFDRERFRKIEGGTFWLSDTPGKCSFGWDAACRRICTWVRLEEKRSGLGFYLFNTHFDHVGKVAREQSARLIIRKIVEITTGHSSTHNSKSVPGNAPVVLCGDFNLAPGSDPIEIICDKLHDAFEVSRLPPYSSVATYHGFTYDDPPKERIDYIFVSEEIRVERYGALTDSRDRTFFSDHLPVLVTLEMSSVSNQ